MRKFLFLISLSILISFHVSAQDFNTSEYDNCKCSDVFNSDTIKQYEEAILKKKSITGYYQLYNKYNQVTWCGYISNSQLYSGLKFVFDTASGFDVTVLNNVGDEQYFEGKSKGECWYNWGAYYMFEKYDKDDSLNSVSGNMRKEAHCYDLNTYKVNYKGQLSQRIHTSHCNVDTCLLRFYWYKYFYNTKGLLSAFSDNGRDTSAGKMIRYYYDTQNRLIKKVDMPRTQYPHPSTTQAIYIYEYFQDGMREEILVKKEDGSVK